MMGKFQNNEDAGHQTPGVMMTWVDGNVKGVLHSPGACTHDTVSWWTRLQVLWFGNLQLLICNCQLSILQAHEGQILQIDN
jgi:hypothetical protein